MPDGTQTKDPQKAWGSPTTRFLLLLLQEEGKVQRCPLTEKTEGWQITDAAWQQQQRQGETQ